MPLEVIGAGHGRTGTFTLKTALDRLGLGPCYHMSECVVHEHFAVWERVFDDKEPMDWEEVFKGYRSTCDAPSIFVYRELAERYPNAKVVLTVRDPESWWRSVSATVHAGRKSSESTHASVNRVFAKAEQYRKRHGGPPDFVHLDHDEAIAAFNRHSEEVRRRIAPERLLVYEVKQGWEPLCKFLGVPVPATPFPVTNSTEDYLTRMRSMTAQGTGPGSSSS